MDKQIAFKNELEKYKFYFSEFEGVFVYQTPDGEVILYKEFITCCNKVINDDYNAFIKLSYPEIDILPLDIHEFIDGFNYFLSYQCYKDYVNKNNDDYESYVDFDLEKYYMV